MDFIFTAISECEAREIAAWKYDPPYDFYDLDEILDSDTRRDYFSVFSEETGLAGYFCFGAEARVPGGDYSGEAVDIGLGMKPELTGKGLGREFLESGLGFARERFSPVRFRLSVAAFNERAIKVYESAGFEAVEGFIQKTDKGEGRRFILMTLEN